MSVSDENIRRILGDCLREHYGIEGALTRLGGENLNYRVDTDDGSTFVFKVVDQDMPPSVVRMEEKVIEHAEKAGLALNLPRIIKSISGKIETRIKLPLYDYDRTRLIAYVPGVEMSLINDISEKTQHSVGHTVGLFNQVMKNFDHPSAYRTHRWDLVKAGQHQNTISLIEDPVKADLLRWAFEQWANRAAVHFEDLPWQFIHGDLNPENLMVEGEEVTGVVDFGDACINPAVCELAICLAYQMMRRDDPLAAAAKVIEGYEQVQPLSPLEREVLIPLACGRLAVTIAVARQRMLIDPSNPTWFGSEEPAWILLEKLSR